MQVFGEVLPLALVVALSPIPIVAIVLVLGTARARANGTAFALGWVLGLAGAMAAFLVVLSGIDHPGEGPGAAKARIAIGVVCAVAAVRKWRGRPRAGEEPKVPGWMRHLDELEVRRAFVLGVLLGAANPKNLGLVAAASTVISRAGHGAAASALEAVAFVAVGSVTVAGAVVAHALFEDPADRVLGRLKAFMLANNALIMAALFAVFAVVLLAEGIGGL